MQVTPSQLITFLTVAIPQRLPILITGKPGVGKTDIGKLVAGLSGKYRINGKSQTFTVTPDSGYAINEVFVDKAATPLTLCRAIISFTMSQERVRSVRIILHLLH